MRFVEAQPAKQGEVNVVFVKLKDITVVFVRIDSIYLSQTGSKTSCVQIEHEDLDTIGLDWQYSK